MATARGKNKTEEDDLTVCSICLERFRNPKYLPCLHTFCEACLSKYITSGYTTNVHDASSKSGFLCPTCRAFTESSTKGLRPDKWAENFPLNHFIVSLIDRERSREKDKICDPCARGDSQRKAEHWCQNCSEALCRLCAKCHLTNKFTLRHTIIILDDLQKHSDVISDPDILCPQHTDKQIETYCYDHETPCCVICLTVNHRSCHKVNTINEATKEIITTFALQSLTKSFLHIHQQILEKINDGTKAVKKAEKNKLEMEKEITDFQKMIESHIDSLANKLRQEVSSEQNQQSEIILKQRNVLQEKSSIAQHYIKVLEKCQENKIQNVRMLMDLKNLKSNQKELTEFIESDAAKMKYINMKFERADDVSKLLSSIKSFGRILKSNGDKEQRKPHETPKFNLHSASPHIIKSVSISIDKLISSATFLPTGHVLFVYCSASKVTLTDLNGKCISSLQLAGYPWDVTLIDPWRAVVTLPGHKHLVYIDIVPSSLSLSVYKTSPLDGECRGICRVGQTLLVTYPTRLNLLDLGGNLVNTINVQRSNGLYFVNQHKNNIYLSDYRQHCVVCINNSGTEIFRYISEKLRYPWKLTNDCEGNIYVAGYTSNNIHQLTSAGKLIRILPLLTINPSCIVFGEEGNRFLISTGSKISFYIMK